MSMNISFKLLDTQNDISKKILISIRDYLRPVLNNVANSVRKNIAQDIEEAVKAEPEYTSLLSGILRSELGVPDAASRIENIFAAWGRGAVFTVRPVTIKAAGLSGGFSLSMIQSDFSDILGLSDATIVDGVSGSNVEWLRWLLLEGGKQIIVRNYTVAYPGSNNRSRTGNAIMVKSTKNWRIPMAFAGSPTNNWITRAISRLDDTILNRLENELERNL